MDNILKEFWSRNVVEASLFKTERVIPYINCNDKTPSWDGEIFLYNGKSFNKSDIQGRIPVQLKGTHKENLSKRKIKYRIERSHLKNYYADGGVLLFVVYVKDFDNYKIYFNCLLPFDLNKILATSTTESQEISLKEFPEDRISIINILLNFIENSKKQVSNVQEEILSMKDFFAKKVPYKEITIGVNGIYRNEMEALQYTLNNPTYFYVKLNELDVSIPIDCCEFDLIERSGVAINVCVDGIEYFREGAYVLTKDKKGLKLGKGITWWLENGEIGYKNLGNLSERIYELNFICKLMDCKNCTLGDELLNDFKLNVTVEQKKKLSEKLIYLKRVKQMLNELGVEKELECDQLTESDERSLFNLTNAILDGKEVTFREGAKINLFSVKTIGNIKLGLILDKVGDDSYKVSNLFDEKTRDIYLFYKGENSEKAKASKYIGLGAKNFLELDNINWENIYRELRTVPFSTLWGDGLTTLFLELLKAYDIKKQDTFLKCAEEIIEILIKNSGINAYIILNKLQLIKRTREFTMKELNELCELKKDTDPKIQWGCCILMENYKEAEIYYARMKETERNTLSQTPIYNLWKRSL